MDTSVEAFIKSESFCLTQKHLGIICVYHFCEVEPQIDDKYTVLTTNEHILDGKGDCRQFSFLDPLNRSIDRGVFHD